VHRVHEELLRSSSIRHKGVYVKEIMAADLDKLAVLIRICGS